MPQGMGAVTSQASLNEADVSSQVQFCRAGYRCEKLAAIPTGAGGWMHQPGEGGLRGALTASTTGSFSHLEELALHIGGLF